MKWRWRNRRLCGKTRILVPQQSDQAKTPVTPLDRIKILCQTSISYYSHHTRTWTEFGRALQKLQHTQGLQGLLRGHATTPLKIYPYAALTMLLTSNTERDQYVIRTMRHRNEDSWREHWRVLLLSFSHTYWSSCASAWPLRRRPKASRWSAWLSRSITNARFRIILSHILSRRLPSCLETHHAPAKRTHLYL